MLDVGLPSNVRLFQNMQVASHRTDDGMGSCVSETALRLAAEMICAYCIYDCYRQYLVVLVVCHTFTPYGLSSLDQNASRK